MAPAVWGQDFPRRKPGLWEINTSSRQAAQGSTRVQMCIDENTNDLVQQQGLATKDGCSRHDMKRNGSEIVVDSVCRLGETTATTHSVFTGSFDSLYKVETRSSYDPPLMGMREGHAVIEAKWLGACKPDQKPGDMILGNGMKININDTRTTPAASPAPKR